MKSQRLEALVRGRLLQDLPGFAAKRKLVFRTPVGPVLGGFCFDDSSFNADLAYVWVFVLPLYVPTKHLTLTFGHRLENKQGLFRTSQSWTLAEPVDEREVEALRSAMVKQGLPFLNQLESPQKLIENLRAATKLRSSIFVEQAIAFSLARMGAVDLAKRKLKSVSEAVKPTDSWQHVKDSSDQLSEAIDRGDHQGQLDEWTDDVIKNLRLEKIIRSNHAESTGSRESA